VRNRRRVVYYAILLLLILGELLGERNYIIIIFPEYDTPSSLPSDEEINLIDLPPLTKRQHVQYLPQEAPEAHQ